MINTPNNSALQVVQQAIAALLKWVNVDLPIGCECSESPVVQEAKRISSWTQNSKIGTLQLLFDQVKLSDVERRTEVFYCPMLAIGDSNLSVPYPSAQEPDEAEQNRLKQQIQTNVVPILAENWQNLSLLMLILEKYGSCLSFGESTVALIDRVRITAGIAAALSTDATATHLSLIAGDLSGIQQFIYTISSDGALKSLRARSFYLELVTEEVVQQLLEELNLPRTSIIYAGGGNLYLIAPIQEVETKIARVRERLNQWLKAEFQGKVFLALACHQFETEKVADHQFADEWDKVIREVNQQKTQKFSTQLQSLLEPRSGHTPCKVCHRDDMTEDYLDRLNKLEANSPLACETCQDMFDLGGKLFEVKSIVRSQQAQISGAVYTIAFKFSKETSDRIYYHLFSGSRPVISSPELTFLINNWSLEDYQFRYFRGNVVSLLLGNYYQQTTEPDEKGFITAQEMAEKGEGIKRVGYLRMDVDRLGQIFAKGLLKSGYSLPKLAGLSRQMSYFFKVYLNSLAGDRQTNFLNHCDTYKFKSLNDKPRDEIDEKYLRKNLLFIYAGGDDLFVSGSWDEIVEFAFDVYQSFRAYTGNNPDITLSAGISLEVPKFPLYQAATSAGEAEEQAKGNDRDSLGLFGTAFKWSEWLGTVSLKDLENLIGDYLANCERPPLLGIWDFVSLLQTQLSNSYKRSFVRNLLLTAQIQEQQLEEKKQAIEQHRNTTLKAKNESAIKALQQEEQDIRYYLHLPKIAYTLARLPSELRQKDEFRPMRISLLSPYNARYFRAIATWIELLNRN